LLFVDCGLSIDFVFVLGHCWYGVTDGIHSILLIYVKKFSASTARPQIRANVSQIVPFYWVLAVPTHGGMAQTELTWVPAAAVLLTGV